MTTRVPHYVQLMEMDREDSALKECLQPYGGQDLINVLSEVGARCFLLGRTGFSPDQDVELSLCSLDEEMKGLVEAIEKYKQVRAHQYTA